MREKGVVSSSGYLTVYLALIMAILLSLYLALIEGARSNAFRLEAEIVTDIGMNSVMAEYHRELYRQYNLFAIDTSYGTAQTGRSNVEAHLEEYVKRNMSYEDVLLDWLFYRDFLAMSLKELELTRVSNLTDEKGAVFRRRAVEAIQDDVGITLMESLAEWMKTVTEYRLNERDIAKEKSEIDTKIQEYDDMEILVAEEKWDMVQEQTPDGKIVAKRVKVSDAEYHTVEIENPTDGLEEIRKKGSLYAVVENPEQLSEKSIFLDNLVAARMNAGTINQGNWSRVEVSEAEMLTERFFFQEYLLKYMSRYGCEKENKALQYQMEYLVSGKDSDLDNLYNAVSTLCAIREVANTVYLFADEEKCNLAGAMATVLATLMMVPEVADLLKVTLLFGWAYAESLYDLEVLLEGGRVPLLKDDNTWHYDLESALNPSSTSVRGEIGLSYEDYLRILMSLTDLNTLTARALNMVEADIRQTPGNVAFRLDACYDCIEAYIEIESTFGYQYEITRQKKY